MTARALRTVVLGIGNPDRGDDAAGRLVVRRLADSLPDGVELIEHDGEAASLLACMEGADAVYWVDACASGAAPGVVHRFDVAAAPLPSVGLSLSTHGLGLGEALELARALGALPPRAIVYAIEGGSFVAGAAPSAPVSAAIAEVASRLRREITARGVPHA